MGEMNVAVTLSMEPDTAWNIASDLTRLDEWLTIFDGWKSEVPSTVEKGTQVSITVKVESFRNVIDWLITEYDAPSLLKMSGSGRGGVKLDLTVHVSPHDGGSLLELRAGLHGGLLGGPIGRLIARVLKSDAQDSIENLAALR
ncbi:type II toxin-antitoxin system Rv0910 family toxin [Antrihabitans cavernicola]|uniref:SRPBCC family protein n=1 Tax=Antrihabitans cavernicola TaxID=2495913 RepID=A0A5A7S7Y3_9NOCA|nr:SRPBCC family protein [Spelaeibacter cavernicola]KAA0022268.1 SRPBCC family protein [Spelaeibacter cavernicola]